MPAFTGDLEPRGCRFVGVRAFVLTRVHVSSKLIQKQPRTDGEQDRHRFFSSDNSLASFYLPFFFLWLKNSTEHPLSSLFRNACRLNDNARASLRFEFRCVHRNAMALCMCISERMEILEGNIIYIYLYISA